MAVTRCVCHDVTLAELVGLARALRGREGGDARPPASDEAEAASLLEALAERTSCGTGCGSCRPYIRVALMTGRVSLPVLPRV